MKNVICYLDEIYSEIQSKQPAISLGEHLNGLFCVLECHENFQPKHFCANMVVLILLHILFSPLFSESCRYLAGNTTVLVARQHMSIVSNNASI